MPKSTSRLVVTADWNPLQTGWIVQAAKDVRPTDVMIEVYAGSAIVRISIERQDEAMAPVEVEQFVSHFSATKIEAVLNLTVLQVTKPFGNLGEWSEWFDLDDPTTGGGDAELIAQIDTPCGDGSVSGIHCETTDGLPWRQASQQLAVPCSIEQGGLVCLTKDNPAGCLDYRVRFACDMPTTPPSLAPTPAPTVTPTPMPTLVPTRAPTGVPSTEDNRCLGVDCSGHGRCVDKHIGGCMCDAGWFRANCSEVPVLLSVAGNTSECADQSRLPVEASQGQQSLRCRADRTAWHEHATATVTLLTMPTANVRCVLSSLNTAEAVPSEAAIEFEQGQEVTSASTEIAGRIDAKDDGPRRLQVAVRCTSGDRRFETAAAQSTVTNLDVPLPRVAWMYPALSPYISTQVTICQIYF